MNSESSDEDLLFTPPTFKNTQGKGKDTPPQKGNLTTKYEGHVAEWAENELEICSCKYCKQERPVALTDPERDPNHWGKPGNIEASRNHLLYLLAQRRAKNRRDERLAKKRKLA